MVDTDFGRDALAPAIEKTRFGMLDYPTAATWPAVVLVCIVVGGYSSVSFAALFGPSTYPECVIDAMRGGEWRRGRLRGSAGL